VNERIEIMLSEVEMTLKQLHEVIDDSLPKLVNKSVKRHLAELHATQPTAPERDAPERDYLSWSRQEKRDLRRDFAQFLLLRANGHKRSIKAIQWRLFKDLAHELQRRDL
jgi:hypothetical protein